MIAIGYIGGIDSDTKSYDWRARLSKLLVFQRADCKWAWHLEADNGAVIATDGSQGYNNEADAQRIADRVVQGAYSDAERWRRPKDGC